MKLSAQEHAILASKLNDGLNFLSETIALLSHTPSKNRPAIEAAGHSIHYLSILKAHLDSVCAMVQSDIADHRSPYYPEP